MAWSLCLKSFSTSSSAWLRVSSRALTVSASLQAKSQPVDDPVKKIFLEKMKEYRSQASKGGKLPKTTPEAEKQLQEELARLKRIYGEEDMSKFPKFEFTDKSS